MTPQQLPFGKAKRPSLTDRLEHYFLAHPGEVVTMPTIAQLVGVAGARQRRLEVEKRGRYLERREWKTDDGRHHLGWIYWPLGQRGPKGTEVAA